jgi:hypothetical protein
VTLMRTGQCTNCFEEKLVGPLHLEKRGPDFCLPCGTEGHARQARDRKRHQSVLQAFGFGASYAGPHELTLELLEEAVRLTHPDRHPPERAEQAARVTAELLALKPFVLPKPAAPRNESATVAPAALQTSVTRLEELMKRIRPCEICRETIPATTVTRARIGLRPGSARDASWTTRNGSARTAYSAHAELGASD